jgi:hypothetical protein
MGLILKHLEKISPAELVTIHQQATDWARSNGAPSES